MKHPVFHAKGASGLFAAFVLGAILTSPVVAKPAKSAAKYCLKVDRGGSDCSFNSLRECQQSASGIAAQCQRNVFRRGTSSI